VVCDAEVILSKEDTLTTQPLHPDQLDALSEQWGVASSVGRLRAAMGTVPR